MKTYFSDDKEFFKEFNLEDDDYISRYLLFCDVCDEDVEDCIKEYNLYQKKQGHIFKEDGHKNPNFTRFICLFWGDLNVCSYNRTKLPVRPDVFKCSNSKVSSMLCKFLNPLEFNNGTIWCKVVQSGRFVYVDVEEEEQ